MAKNSENKAANSYNLKGYGQNASNANGTNNASNDASNKASNKTSNKASNKVSNSATDANNCK